MLPSPSHIVVKPKTITPELLESAHLLELQTGERTEFTDAEVNTVHAYLRRGGSLLTVIDEDRRTPLLPRGFNLLLEPFGLTYTPDVPYVHNCGAIARAGLINAEDREVPYSGGRAISGGTAFAWQINVAGELAEPFAAYTEINGGGRIVALAEAMAYMLMGTRDGVRLSGVPRDPSKTTYWGPDAHVFMQEIRTWLLAPR